MNTKKPKRKSPPKRGCKTARAKRPPVSRNKISKSTIFRDVGFSSGERRYIIRSICENNNDAEYGKVDAMIDTMSLEKILNSNPGKEATDIIYRYLYAADEPVSEPKPEPVRREEPTPSKQEEVRPHSGYRSSKVDEDREVLTSIQDLGVRSVIVKAGQLDYVTQYTTIEQNGNIRVWKSEEYARKYAQDLDDKVKIIKQVRLFDSSVEGKEEHEAVDTVLGYYDDVRRGKKVERVYFEFYDKDAKFREVASYNKKRVVARRVR